MDYILLSLIFLPFCLAFFLFFMKSSKMLWLTALLGGAVCFGLNLALLLENQETLVVLPLFSHFGIGFEANSVALIYGLLTCACWIVALILCGEYFKQDAKHLNRLYGAMFVALSGTLGVFYAYDLLTMVIFFELMSLSSYLWVLHEEDKEAIKASNIYLGFGIAGGLCILFGIFILTGITDDLRISALLQVFSDPMLQQRAIIASFFLLLGFGAKAGLFVLHDWMPTSYTFSPAPATALLSGILGKCGVYGIIVMMIRIIPEVHGFSIFLLFLSLCNMLVGAAAALLSGNFKRTLAYSSVSQMGFIFWGIAMINLLGSHNTFGAYGTLFHMINHSLIKVLFFCLSGIVLTRANTLELEKLQGFGRGKPWFQALFTVAAVSMAGVPLFSGYVSKTLLHESIVEYMHYYPEWTGGLFYLYEWGFLLAGGFTVAYMTKLYYCFFLCEGEWPKEAYARKRSLLALSGVALTLLILGLSPNLSFAWIGEFTADFFAVHVAEEVHYFSWVNLKGSITSLLIGAVIFTAYYSINKNLNHSMFTEKVGEKDNFIDKFWLPVIEIASFIFAVLMRIFDIALEMCALRVTQRSFKSLTIPETFYYGEENQEKKKDMKVKFSQTLAYSLLMFGLGFIFTIVYLLVVGGTISYEFFVTG